MFCGGQPQHVTSNSETGPWVHLSLSFSVARFLIAG
jgi:hypothetical protein